MVNSLSSPTIIVLLERDYYYMSVGTQIPYDAGLAPVPYAGRKQISTDFHSTSAKHHYTTRLTNDHIYI